MSIYSKSKFSQLLYFYNINVSITICDNLPVERTFINVDENTSLQIYICIDVYNTKEMALQANTGKTLSIDPSCIICWNKAHHFEKLTTT